METTALKEFQKCLETIFKDISKRLRENGIYNTRIGSDLLRLCCVCKQNIFLTGNGDMDKVANTKHRLESLWGQWTSYPSLFQVSSI